MAFVLYLLGFIVLTSGIAWLATLAGISEPYVEAGALVLLAIGVISSVAGSRGRKAA
jgi:hypothetical protein